MAVTPAEIIERRRTELGLSQAQLAERIGRAASTIRRWERGEAKPPASIMPTLANALQVAPRDLMVAFGLEQTEPPTDVAEAAPPVADEQEPQPKLSPQAVDVAEVPTEAVAIPAAAPTAVAAPPQQRPVRRSPLRRAAATDPSEGLSYVEDSRQRMRYWLRAILTAVVGLILLLVLFWAFGELAQALGDVWELFGDDAPPPTAPGTDF